MPCRSTITKVPASTPSKVVSQLSRLSCGSTAAGDSGLRMPLTWGFAHLAKSMLFGVTSADPLSYFAAALLVALVALAASSIPTWRAASVEPMRALRYE